MNVTVDEWLGDDILMSVSGGAWVTIKAFVQFDHGGLGLDAIDELQQRQRIKVSKAIVAEPGDLHRFRASKLGADTWKPVAKDPDNDGSYWVFDIQKAAA